MSRDERLIEKFLSKKNITANDCDRLLTGYGYKLYRSSGSHRVYHQKGTTPITVVIPKNFEYLKPGYINLIIKRLKLED